MRVYNLFPLYCCAFVLLLFFSHTNASSEASLKCWACRGAVEGLRNLYEKNATRESILKVAVYACEYYADNDALICEGIVSQFRDSFIYVLKQLLFRPSQLCGWLLKDCGTPLNPFETDWSLSLPPKPSMQKQPKQINLNNKLLTVLQLSDLHFDPKYEPDSEADCHFPLCCQKHSKHNGENLRQPAGYWGTLGKCDVPYHTIVNMLQHINETHKLDYVMLTGDYMSHSDWTYTRKEHLKVIESLNATLNKYLPDVPIYWVIGNHEGIPVNSFAPHFAPGKFQPHWLYQTVWSAEKRWVPFTEKPNALYRGSYVVLIADNLKLITLNTGYCETTNFFLYLNQTDPDGSMSWLVNELVKCEYDGTAAHIMAHIPPGDIECLEGWAKNYYRVVNRFKNTIKAQFFGHVHTDSFTMFYEDMNDANSKPTGLLYSAPSVTTFKNLNPAYRIYNIDSNTAEVLDFDTYFLNLTNIKDLPIWELLYSAKKEYGLNDLSADSWNSLSKLVYENETIYQKFLKNYVRQDNYNCDVDCRTELLCSIRRGHHNETALCKIDSGILNKALKLPSTSLIKIKNKNKSIGTIIDKKLLHNEIIHSAKEALWKKIASWASRKII